MWQFYSLMLQYRMFYGCHRTWKNWHSVNFFLKSVKTRRSYGKALKEHLRQGKI